MKKEQNMLLKGKRTKNWRDNLQTVQLRKFKSTVLDTKTVRFLRKKFFQKQSTLEYKWREDGADFKDVFALDVCA